MHIQHIPSPGMCSQILCISSAIIAFTASSAHNLRARHYKEQNRKLLYINQIPSPAMSHSHQMCITYASASITMYPSSSLVYFRFLIFSDLFLLLIASYSTQEQLLFLFYLTLQPFVYGRQIHAAASKCIVPCPLKLLLTRDLE